MPDYDYEIRELKKEIAELRKLTPTPELEYPTVCELPFRYDPLSIRVRDLKPSSKVPDSFRFDMNDPVEKKMAEEVELLRQKREAAKKAYFNQLNSAIYGRQMALENKIKALEKCAELEKQKTYSLEDRTHEKQRILREVADQSLRKSRDEFERSASDEAYPKAHQAYINKLEDYYAKALEHRRRKQAEEAERAKRIKVHVPRESHYYRATGSGEKFEAYEISKLGHYEYLVARRTHNTFRALGTFAYVDVGAWFGTRHEFVLIHCVPNGMKATYTIVYCEWDEKGHMLAPKTTGDTLINEFLQHELFIHRIEIKAIEKHTCYRKKFVSRLKSERASQRLYLFIGDLHLTLINKHTPVSSYKDLPGRLRTGKAAQWAAYKEDVERDWKGVFRAYVGWVTALADNPVFHWIWKKYILDGDIFGQAAFPLIDLLLRLKQWPKQGQLVLGQIGDMYEHWIGLECLFVDKKDGKVHLKPKYKGQKTISIIKKWIQLTNESHTYVRVPAHDIPFQYLDYNRSLKNVQGAETVCLPKLFHDRSMNKRVLISGNHDCYIRGLSDLGELSDAKYASGTAPMPPTQTHACHDGIWMEHGHICDDYNRDGDAEDGHHTTQAAWVEKQLIRELDGKQFKLLGKRKMHVTDGARRYLEHFNSEDTKHLEVFVMGHTHIPYHATVHVDRGI